MYYLYVKDHLGNVRFVAQTNGTVKQTYQYYPFGKRWDDMGETFKQPYLYNGKEFDEMRDLNWYDYGARMYEPALGRFMTMDPMAEKYYNVSPYAYCNNNPINYYDPTGTQIEQPQKEREKAEGEGYTYYGPIEKPLEPVYPEFVLISAAKLGTSVLKNSFSLININKRWSYLEKSLEKFFTRKQSITELVQGSKLERSKNPKIYQRHGDSKTAEKDFKSLKLDNIREIDNGKINGLIGEKGEETFIFRDWSTDGRPTIEMQTRGKIKIKIRYGEKKK